MSQDPPLPEFFEDSPETPENNTDLDTSGDETQDESSEDVRPGVLDMDALMAMDDGAEIEVDGVETAEPETSTEKAPGVNPAAKAARGLQAQAMKAMVEAQQLEKDQLKTTITNLEKDLEFQRENYTELVETAKRRQADFDNFRKRVSKEKEEARREGKAKAALGLLGILDNLNRALENVPDAVPEEWLGGVLLTQRQFGKVLEQWEVKEVSGKGEDFDPAFHEAVMIVESDQANIVMEVFERGYVMGERLLRAAKVSVSKKAAPAADPAPDQASENGSDEPEAG